MRSRGGGARRLLLRGGALRDGAAPRAAAAGKGAPGAVLVYVRCGGDVHGVEVDPAGTAADLVAALRTADRTADGAAVLTFAGEPLPLAAALAEAGVGQEAVVDLCLRRSWAWCRDRRGPACSVAADDARVASGGESDRGSVLAAGPPLTGGVHRWRVVLAAVDPCGCSAFAAGVSALSAPLHTCPANDEQSMLFGSGIVYQLGEEAGIHVWLVVNEVGDGWDFELDCDQALLRVTAVRGGEKAGGDPLVLATPDGPLLPCCGFNANAATLRVESI